MLVVDCAPDFKEYPMKCDFVVPRNAPVSHALSLAQINYQSR